MKKVVLLYGLAPEQEKQLKRLLLPHKLSVRSVPPEEYGLPLGAAAGWTPRPNAVDIPEEKPQGAFLVMGNLLPEELNRVLAACRKAGVGREIIKAVITPHNVEWNACQLYRQVLEEHRAMHGQTPGQG